MHLIYFITLTVCVVSHGTSGCIHDMLQKHTLSVSLKIPTTSLLENRPFRFQLSSLAMNDTKGKNCQNVGDRFVTGESSTKKCDSRDPGAFADCYDICGSQDLVTRQKEAKAIELVQQIFNLYSGILSLDAQTDPWCLTANKCGPGGPDVPPNHQCNNRGIFGDMIVYLTIRPVPNGVLAWSTYCAENARTGRPVASWININPAILGNPDYPEETILATLKHEMMHVLGFSVNSFVNYKNPKGEPWENILAFETKKFKEYSKTYIKIVLPTLIQEAQNHFSCNNITGVYLEDYGSTGTIASHWKQLYLFNELMIGSAIRLPQYGLVFDGSDQPLSRLTLALLKDSGFYSYVNLSKADYLSWGRNATCKFFDRCENWDLPGYGCTREERGCSHDYGKKSGCKLAQWSGPLEYYQRFQNDPTLGGILGRLMEYCPLMLPITNCKSRSSTGNSLESFGSSSFCFQSTIRREEELDGSNQRCFDAFCVENIAHVKVGNTTLLCPTGKSITPSLNGIQGTIQCPNNDYFCEIVSKKTAWSTSYISATSKASISSTLFLLAVVILQI